ncbi:MAG: zinc ribbon domain-containing protein [Theionarchaea archaeon]|nr:MAG: hypothetical protein AYK18_00745 [Theionarchaea archaeon DG-70]MBU7012446.1 zinc ribbon domain-containing protein [Theionarchaea archaeon]
MKYTDILVGKRIEDTKRIVQQIFEQNGFKVEWKELYSGKAARGSKGMNIAFGAFAQHYAIDFQIIPSSDETTAIRLIKSSSGWWGGAVGAHKTEKQYEKIVEMVSNQFEKVCPECTHINRADSSFCEKCGSSLLVVS